MLSPLHPNQASAGQKSSQPAYMECTAPATNGSIASTSRGPTRSSRATIPQRKTNGTTEAIDRLNLETGDVVRVAGQTGLGKTTLIEVIDLFADVDTLIGRRILINNERALKEYHNNQPSERLYAFKLNFARQMVNTHGRFCDYKRLRRVQEEAPNAIA